MSRLPRIIRHVAGDIYLGPDLTPLSEAEQRTLLHELSDEGRGTLSAGLDAPRAKTVGLQLIRARIERTQFERSYRAAQAPGGVAR